MNHLFLSVANVMICCLLLMALTVTYKTQVKKLKWITQFNDYAYTFTRAFVKTRACTRL